MTMEKLALALTTSGQTLSTVESCTGGGIASRCTDLAGSSQWFVGSVVTYSNDMKVRLGVKQATLDKHGAVSEAVVCEMATHGRAYCDSDWCISVSGIAGPDGGTIQKPVGTVWFAWAGPGHLTADCVRFQGDRASVRAQAVQHATDVLVSLLS